MTKSSKINIALIEQGEKIEFETAAIAAAVSPLAITTMGAFPLSIIASGQIRRCNFETLRAEGATGELKSSQQTETGALTRCAKTAGRCYPPPTVTLGRARWHCWSY
jgi:hypothetical protein